ncbi:MAG TPA: hypothetical protein VMI72_13210 [Roseiarcus sp.]|nr:hypothetical protein [Roseiarcus sp.]
MAGLLWSKDPYGLFTFIVITLLLGGLGAWATGRAMAQTWRPLPMLLPYMVFLTAGVRFLHYALYGEPLLSLQYFLVAYAWTMIVGAFAYRYRRAAQMATQYSWIYEQNGLNWRGKGRA